MLHHNTNSSISQALQLFGGQQSYHFFSTPALNSFVIVSVFRADKLRAFAHMTNNITMLHHNVNLRKDMLSVAQID